MDLEEVWRIREEEIFPALFGQESRGIFPLDYELFSVRLAQADRVDPHWLTHGVIEFAPTAQRASWLYVTSGYSNPWEVKPNDYDPGGESGSGVEFTLQTTEPGDWAIRTLQGVLAFDLLLSAGRFPGKSPLDVHDRIPLRAPINGDDACLIRNLILTMEQTKPSEFALPSGKVLLPNLVGITDAELSFAKANDSVALLEMLRTAGRHIVTDPRRASLV